MKPIHFWRRSLAFRIVTMTFVLSLAVIWLLGSALLSRVTGGLMHTKVEASLVEAATVANQAQSRLGAADQSDLQGISPLVDQVISYLAANAATPGESDLVLLRSPGADQSFSLDRTSNLVDAASIPMDLRRAVEGSARQAWRYLRIRYVNGTSVSGIGVGSKIDIPGAGTYELYSLFATTAEAATLDLVMRALVTVGAALLLLLCAITFLVVRQVVAPVRAAARLSQRIAAGELEQRMAVHGQDDLAVLARSFNEMALSLQEQINALENLSQLQQRFVSDVSHELRTPLTTVRMASDVLHASRQDFQPAVARSAELLMAQLDRFEALLAELLEISRFDAGVATLEIDHADIRELVLTAVDALTPVAETRGSQFVQKLPPDPVISEVDSRRINRILRNLLSNALEYGESPIEVTLVVTDSAFAIGVLDQGPGMTPDEVSRVFDRFWRADPARARTSGGTGLGLSIALEDARLHSGWLDIWSEPGIGTHMRLTIPLLSGGLISESPITLEPLRAR
ncbi:MAG TPA: MtrAB system histidine kinase MtrB [Candidatus Nanopelagicaceae bacterium]|nr:MtrAB system histidine kinase MtrB [Candidatus Nanopelagicaceae bacterium]